MGEASRENREGDEDRGEMLSVFTYSRTPGLHGYRENAEHIYKKYGEHKLKLESDITHGLFTESSLSSPTTSPVAFTEPNSDPSSG